MRDLPADEAAHWTGQAVLLTVSMMCDYARRFRLDVRTWPLLLFWLIVCPAESADSTRADVVSDLLNMPEEELDEFKQALDNNDLLEAADALTDILYVTYGAGHAFGINLDHCFEEVQNSNMSKLGNDGKPIYNDQGKVMKGPNYYKPDLSKFIR